MALPINGLPRSERAQVLIAPCRLCDPGTEWVAREARTCTQVDPELLVGGGRTDTPAARKILDPGRAPHLRLPALERHTVTAA